MVLETRASLEAGVIGAGHRFATSRLDAQRSTAGWAKEQMGGIAYLGFIRALAGRVDSEWDAVKARHHPVLVDPSPPCGLGAGLCACLPADLS